MKSATGRAGTALVVLAALLGLTGCLGESPPTSMDYDVTGKWELEATPFETVEQGSIPVTVELEELGGGVVDIRASWQGIPIRAQGVRTDNVMSVRGSAPGIAEGLIVAHFKENRVEGNAEGTYRSGSQQKAGKGVFLGDRAEFEANKTGVAGVDALGDLFQRTLGAVFFSPDMFEAGGVAVVGLVGAVLLMLLAGLARLGQAGKAVAWEGDAYHTRVLKGSVAAGHLAYFGYVSIDDEGYCELEQKLVDFDTSKAAAEDGVRGVRYTTIQDGARTLVSVPDLILIVQLA